jgi:hypothetical protein
VTSHAWPHESSPCRTDGSSECPNRDDHRAVAQGDSRCLARADTCDARRAGHRGRTGQLSRRPVDVRDSSTRTESRLPCHQSGVGGDCHRVCRRQPHRLDNRQGRCGGR